MIMIKKIGMFFMICFVIVVAIIKSRKYNESFDLGGDITRAFNNVSNLTSTVTTITTRIPGEAANIANSALEVLIKPAKDGLKTAKGVLGSVETEVNKMFEIIKDIFNKIKYFSELLIVILKRSQRCALGASKVTKNYETRTREILLKIKPIMKKLEICPTKPFKNIIKYWKNCITQIFPFLGLALKYVNILRKFYSEVLTYPELFPQGSDAVYCKSAWTGVTTQNDALNYAKQKVY